jgi:hypothetical protein
LLGSPVDHPEMRAVRLANLKGTTPMERAATAHRQLRCVLWLTEACIIIIAAVTSVQIATETGGSIWACGPVAIIAVMEMMRVPLAGWAAHLRPLAMFGAFIVMAAVSILTFEGMAIAVERFMHQRVVEVYAAREAFDAAKLTLDDESRADARYKAAFDQMTAEIDKRRQLVADLQGKQPAKVDLPRAAPCSYVDKRGHTIVYACQNKAADVAVQTNADAQHAHDREVADAAKSLADAEAQLKGLQKPVHTQDNAVALADAQKALEKAASDSTMYRVASAWFGTPAKDLTPEQFERFKRIAVVAVAASAATATMLVSFISHAIPRERRSPSKLVRAIRAYFARKRKNVVRTVEKVVEKPVEKLVEVIKHIEVPVDRIVTKTVEVPVEKIIVKHIHVPVDINTHRIINRDGSLGDDAPLHVLKGGKP